MTIIMEWLSTVNELHEARLTEAAAPAIRGQDSRHLPPGVATAMNIYRHEMIERIGGRRSERYSDWRGRAREVAEGQRDHKKQAALYVGIRQDGDVESLPPMSQGAFDVEVTRGKALLEFARDVDRKCIFAYREYELFAGIFRAMFTDLASEQEYAAAPRETISSGIPGVVFVKRTITVANVVPPDLGEQGEAGIDTPNA
jgi:hypothetical protein